MIDNIEMLENSDNKFAVTENLVKNISRGFTTLVYSSTVMFLTVPGALQFHAYMTDNVTPTTYVATFRDMFDFLSNFYKPNFINIFNCAGITFLMPANRLHTRFVTHFSV